MIRAGAAPCWCASRRSARLPDSMRLIGLAVALTVSLVLAPLAADAQQPKVYRIGVLSTGNPRSAAIYQALEQRLHELGYIEGQNLAIEFRNAEGKTDRLPGLAAELVRLNVDVIVVATDPGTCAAKEASAKDPHRHRERQL